MSSWYGPGFHGRLTANGEVFDMYAPTAAHVSLPLGSLVRLVNPTNGRSRLVRINDRGPIIEGRELDVSYEVAESLGFTEQGLARLRIELLEVPKPGERRYYRASNRSAGL
jgi:rare lipoprotein A